MKACIVLQNQYAKIGHAIARTLQDRHGVSEFCAYVYSPGAARMVREQTDIVYTQTLVDHELHARFEEEKIDMDYLANFEKTHTPPNLWLYMYCDRKLMMSMGPKEETTTVLDPLYPGDHDAYLKIFQTRAKAIEKMLRDARPDFLLFFAIGTIGHMLLYHTAKKLGIATYNIDFPRVQNRICISTDYHSLTIVEDTFRKFCTKNAETRAHEEARQLLAKFRETGSLDLQYMDIALGVLPKGRGIGLHGLFRSLQYLVTLTKNFTANHKLFTYGNTDQNPLRFVGQKLKQRYRIWHGIEDLYKPVDLDVPYVYYPMHYEPELATLLLSPFYYDQLQLVRFIARSLPIHMKLYVKEHPAMVSKRARSFYTSLRQIPNVVLVDHRASSFELTKNAALVTTISGTAGWEGSLLGKPVLTFGDVFYNALSGVTRVHDIEELPNIIRARLDTSTKNEAEIVHFLAAVLQESVRFDFSKLWYEESVENLMKNKGLTDFCDYLMTIVRARRT